MKHYLFKILHILDVPRVLRFYKYRNNLVTILCLHRISDEDSVTMPPMKVDDFERLLQYLNKYYQVISINEISAFIGKKPAIVLSFDDGFFDFFENALPLLKKYRFPCNVNVITRCLDGDFQIWTQRLNNLLDEIFRQKYSCSFEIGKEEIVIDKFDRNIIFYQNIHIFRYLFAQDEFYVEKFLKEAENKMPFPIPITPMMSWDDLMYALDHYDIELGSHSVSHIVLANIHQKDKLFAEINDSKKIIEKKTGKEVKIFTSPNGNYNEEIVQFCQEAGYEKMLIVDEELLPQKNYNDFLLPRILIAYEDYYENLLRVENFQNMVKKIVTKTKK
jgi:peptidoglycan/xylan/chitin deacetylase (PgdA/CDA1 family)